MTDALEYNKAQDYSKSEVAFIQRRVGSSPDGAWGPNTVAAIERWQKAHRIHQDGKVRRSMEGNTWPRLLAAGADAWSKGTPGITRVGLWTFSSACRSSSEECGSNFATATSAQVTDISFTVNSATEPSFAPPVSAEDVAETGKRYRDAGIDVSVNAFIYPSADFVDALVDYVLDIDARVGLRRLDVDAEELWIRNGDQQAHDSAAALFGKRLAAADFAIAINGIVYTNYDALDPLIRQDCVTHILPQAYSTAGHLDKQGAPDRVYNPIDLQALAVRKWTSWWPTKKLLGGFATYDQPGSYELGTLTEELALGLALRTWADSGVDEVVGWSAKQVSEVGASVLRERQRK